MNRKTLSIALMSMCGAAAFCGSALAHDDAMFKMMDGNKDGKISSAEHAAGAKKMFAGMDTDKDGFVTATEMDAYGAKMWKDKDEMKGDKDMKSDKAMAKKGTAATGMKDDDDKGMKDDDEMHEHKMSSADKIATMDTDGDGKLSAAEHDAGAAKMFTETDTNHDGNVTRAEMEAGMKKMMAKDAAPPMDNAKH